MKEMAKGKKKRTREKIVKSGYLCGKTDTGMPIGTEMG